MTIRRFSDGSNVVSGPDGINVVSHLREALIRARKEGDAYDRMQLLCDGDLLSGDGTATPTSVRTWLQVAPPETGDAAPVLRAGYALAASLGTGLRLGAGVWNLASFTPLGGNFCDLTVGLPIEGIEGKTILRVDPSITNWNAVFGTQTIQANTDLTGLSIRGITFDGQSSLNPINAANPLARRYGIAAWAGRRLSVTRCTFLNWDGRNCVILIGLPNAMSEVDVSHCVFDGIGGAYWHDHSTVYVDASNVSIHHNHFKGVDLGTTTPSSAWNTLEGHGHRVNVHDNTVTRYASGGLILAGAAAAVDGPGASFLVHDNIFYGVGTGFSINAGQSISEVDFHDNIIHVDIDRWPNVAGANNYPGLPSRNGVNMNGVATTLTNVSIHHNQIVYLPWTGAAGINDTAVNWRRSIRLPLTDTHVSITDNLVRDCPSAGITVSPVLSMQGWDVSRNTFRNVGKALLGARYQAGLLIGYQAWVGARPVGVADLRFAANRFIDDQATHSLSFPLCFEAGLVRVDAGVTTTNGSNVLTYTGGGYGPVLDAGSLVSGPGIPAGAYLASPNTYGTTGGLTDPYKVVAWNMSVVAGAGAGAGSATITSQPPTVANVEILDTNFRLADGAAIALAWLQAGQVVTIRTFVPSFVAPPAGGTAGGGLATAGSTITDKTTGTIWRQTTAPSGNAWTAT